jgi:hypothetical protein
VTVDNNSLFYLFWGQSSCLIAAVLQENFDISGKQLGSVEFFKAYDKAWGYDDCFRVHLATSDCVEDLARKCSAHFAPLVTVATLKKGDKFRCMFGKDHVYDRYDEDCALHWTLGGECFVGFASVLHEL